MNLKYTLSAFLLATAVLDAKAVDAGPFAEIKQIEDLQWVVTWTDCTFANPGNASLDANVPEQRAYLTTEDNQKIELFYNKQITFPTSGNYFTLNLEGMNLAEGDYVFTIPSGYAILQPGSVLSSPQDFDITIGEEITVSHTVSISPLDVNYFNISWENVTSLTPNKTVGAYMVNQETDENYPLEFLSGDNYSTANIRIENGQLRVNITNNYPVLPSGTYKFYLPADYVWFNGSSVGNEAIDGYEFNYVTPWKEGLVETDGPDDNDLITFTWVNAISVVYNTNYKGDGFGTTGVFVYDTTDEKFDIPYPTNISFDKNVMTISLKDIGLTNGWCQLWVPEDYVVVTVDGEEGLTEGVVYRFEFTNGLENTETPTYQVYNEEATWSVAENDVIDTEKPVEVSWNNMPLTLSENPLDNVNLYSEEIGYKELAYGKDVTVSNDGTKLLIDLSSLPAATYRLNVPEGCVLINVNGETYINMGSSVDNLVIENSGAVKTICNEKGELKIYNINGVEVPSSSKLQNGIYIINGKKVVVK